MNVVNCILAFEPLRLCVWEDIYEKNDSLCWLCCQDYKISIEDHTFVCIVQLCLLDSQRVSCFCADTGPDAETPCDFVSSSDVQHWLSKNIQIKLAFMDAHTSAHFCEKKQKAAVMLWAT